MAQPTTFYTVQPADISSGAVIPLDRFTTLDLAKSALLTKTASTGKEHVILTSTYYLDWPLTTLELDSIVKAFV